MGAAQCTTCCNEKEGLNDKAVLAKAVSAWTEEVENKGASVADVENPGPQEVLPEPPFGESPKEVEEPAASPNPVREAPAEPERKAAGQPGTQFRVQMTRNPTDTIGINLDVTDGVSMVVVGILSGAVKMWNLGHPDALVLQVNDRIVEANGVVGDSDNMLSALKQNTVWDLLVQRPIEIRAVIHRAGSLTLGIDLRYAPNGTSLMISEVEDGPIKEWNALAPQWQIKKYDRIVELNGVRGTSAQLLHAGMDNETLDMCVLHYE